MACTTNEAVETDYKGGEWNLTGIELGATVMDSWVFTDSKGIAIDISADTFTTVIKDDNGDVVQTLTIGAGHEVAGTKNNELVFIIGPPTSSVAGEYTYKTMWNRPSTTENRPSHRGTITIDA